MNKPIVYTILKTIKTVDYQEWNDTSEDVLWKGADPDTITKEIDDNLELMDIRITPIVDEEGIDCLTFLFLYAKKDEMKLQH